MGTIERGFDIPAPGEPSPLDSQSAENVPHRFVGRSRERLSVLRRRAKYITRAAYYIAVHRSFKHWRWALEAEGTQW